MPDGEVGQCTNYADDKKHKCHVFDGDEPPKLTKVKRIENGDFGNEAFKFIDILNRYDFTGYSLNDNNDARLKSIVSTIQKEQNDVIRLISARLANKREREVYYANR